MVDDGLDFILSHFEEPIWPRTISTHATEGSQVLVDSIEEALARFKQAKLLDCRINAYCVARKRDILQSCQKSRQIGYRAF
jgi:hypothetical protein